MITQYELEAFTQTPALDLRWRNEALKLHSRVKGMDEIVASGDDPLNLLIIIFLMLFPRGKEMRSPGTMTRLWKLRLFLNITSRSGTTTRTWIIHSALVILINSSRYCLEIYHRFTTCGLLTLTKCF